VKAASSRWPTLREDILGLVNLVDVVEFREVLHRPAHPSTMSRSSKAPLPGPRTRRASETSAAAQRCLCRTALARPPGVSTKSRTCGQHRQGKEGSVTTRTRQCTHLETYPTKAVHEVVKVDYFVQQAAPSRAPSFSKSSRRWCSARRPTFRNIRCAWNARCSERMHVR